MGKIKTQDVEEFSSHISAVYRSIKDGCLSFLDYSVHIKEFGNLNIEVWRKPTNISCFDFHHSLEHKLEVIRTLKHGAETIPTNSEKSHSWDI